MIIFGGFLVCKEKKGKIQDFLPSLPLPIQLPWLSSSLGLAHTLPVCLLPGHLFHNQVSFLYEQDTETSHQPTEKEPLLHHGSSSPINFEADAQFCSCSVVFICLTVIARSTCYLIYLLFQRVIQWSQVLQPI